MAKHDLRQRFITLPELLLPLAAREELGSSASGTVMGTILSEFRGMRAILNSQAATVLSSLQWTPQTNWNPEP